MTEDEAKTKWCPFVRAIAGTVDADGKSKHVGQQGSYNRIVDGASGNWAFPRAGACIGSLCMAWRWSDDTPRTGPAWKPTEGYCGSAGRP